MAEYRESLLLLATGGDWTAAYELLNHLEALEKERNEFRHAFGVAADTIKMLQAKVEAMEKQEPVAWQAVGGTIWGHKTSQDDRPLYTLPGAQLNLSDPALQKRLAAQWGYVPAELKLDPEHCPICDGTMRLYSRCTNKDCDAFTVTSGQSTYNKVRAFARTVATRLEEQPAPSVPDGWLERGLTELENIRNRFDDSTLMNDKTLIERIFIAMTTTPEDKP